MNRINNINNYETGISSTFGFDYKVKNYDVTKFDFSLAQVINEKENKKMSDKVVLMKNYLIWLDHQIFI